MYYDLAERFAPYVDAFVVVSRHVREELVRRLPHRAADIRHIPSGVPIPATTRRRTEGPLRLVYSGRLTEAKGALLLPEIDHALRARGVDASWTVLGDGPERAAVERAFAPEAEVHFTGALSADAARDALREQDVLVLPSFGEGLSLTLLEAMAAGVVPVATQLESGMREVIEPGRTGWLAPAGDAKAFAAHIARLDANRENLDALSQRASALVRQRHDLATSAAAVHDLIADVADRPTPHRPRYTQGPSRLDRPWLPSLVVELARYVSNRSAR